jgi:CRP-like cAMP-binding protein
MKVNPFNNYLEIEGVSEMRDYLLEKGQVRVINKDERFIREGQKSGLVAYVNRGAFRHLLKHTDGVTEKIAGYSFAGDFLSDYTQFLEKHSAVSIEAIRQSELYVMPFDELASHMKWELRFRIAEAARADIYGRLLLLYRNIPEERYMGLIEHYPEILKEVSLREIASFLKITPETLSRIRKKMLKQVIS